MKLRSQWAKQKKKLVKDQHADKEDNEEEDEQKSESEEEEERAPVKRRESPPPVPVPRRDPKEMKERKERVRDLTRQAYSRENLHTVKSDPLGRHPGRGRSSQGGRGRGRGRGQPNMKLRMNALLEKIKMDAGVD